MPDFFAPDKKNFADLITEIERACEGLVYVSETDSDVTSFAARSIRELSAEKVASAAGVSVTNTVEIISAEAFFARLSEQRDWFGAREKENAKKFGQLYVLLGEHLRDLKVFRFGRVRIDIIVAGIDGEGNAGGVRTFAVET